VLRVVKLHVKALLKSRREVLQWRSTTVDIGVTDRAHGNRRCGELTNVTILARAMAWKPGGGGIIVSLVTRVAADRCVLLAGMKKL
jgi:hypothetical protein